MKYAFRQVREGEKTEALPREARKPYVKRMGYLSSRPAAGHKDALICADGRLQMLIYGQPKEETVVFSEETLYLPTRKEPVRPPKIAHALGKVRRMLAAGEYHSVPGYVMEEVLKDPVYRENMPLSPDGRIRWSIKPNPKHIAFLLRIRGLAPEGARIKGYLRCMDLEKGEAYVRYEAEGSPGLYESRGFVSRAANLAAQEYRFPARRERIVLEAVHERLSGLHEWDGLGRVYDLRQERSFDGSVFRFLAHYDAKGPRPEAGFLGVMRVVADGETEYDNGRLILRNVGRILLLTRIRSFGSREEEERVSEELTRSLRACPDDYTVLIAGQERTHSALMRRTDLCIASEEELLWSTEELLTGQRIGEGVSRALMEKLYHMGRYFLITETGTLPPAKGQYNINVNLQVCSGNLCALPEMMRVFFRFFESKFGDFRVNARNIFGCRGILASVHPDMETGYEYHFSGPWPHEYWISCAGWVFHEFWDYYLTTADEDFLREHIYPGLKEIALFYEDYLTDRDKEGNYIFYPCFSPENGQSGGYPITVNAVMDISVCCEVLEPLIRACGILGREREDAKELAKWKEMLESMPVLLIDEQGGLKEWAKENIRENYEHRHVSHHYGVWPARQINWELAPDLAGAVLISNRMRGQENDSAHGIMHRLFTAIRLNDSQGAEGYIRQILEKGFVNASLMTNHFPHKAYYPDALGAMPAALAECLVSSGEGRIEFLPAVFPGLERGSLRGLRLFTWMTLDLFEWDCARGYAKACMTSLIPQTVSVGIHRSVREIRVNGRIERPGGSGMIFELKEGERTETEFFF